MTAGTVTVYSIVPGHIPNDAAEACLTGDERIKAGRFRLREDAIHWIACRASLRIILGKLIQLPPNEVPLVLSEHGKPALAPPYGRIHFNLSHCADLAVVAVGIDGSVGIDLENVDRAMDLLECESTFCHPAETQNLPAGLIPRAHQLLRIWTAKEAVLKAMGTGLSYPPELIRIHFGYPSSLAVSDRPVDGIENQRLHELSLPGFDGHQLFVSAPDSVGVIRISSAI